MKVLAFGLAKAMDSAGVSSANALMFSGETVSHALASVLKDEPDWTTLPANTPAPIRRLLRRCLEKDRRQRLADAADARLEIADAMTTPAAEPSTTTAVPPGPRRMAALPIAFALAGGALGGRCRRAAG